MSTESLRERKKTRTRNELVTAAMDLFRTQGYDATTVEQIADAAEYARATFFRYFASKEDVLFADADEHHEAFRAALTSAHGARSPWNAARDALINQVISFAATDPVNRRTYVELWFSPSAFNRRLAINMAWEDAIVDFLATERGADPATDIPSRVIAAAMTGTVRAAMQAELAGTCSLENAICAAFDVLENGLRKTATTSRAWIIDSTGAAQPDAS